MRLDHLLSREKAEAEMRRLNRRSIGRRKSKDRDRTVWKAIQWRVKMPKSRFHRNEARLRDRNTVEDCVKFCIVFRAHRTEAERKKSGT